MIKKIILFLISPLLLYNTCFIIGFNRSKKRCFYPVFAYYPIMTILLCIGVSLLILITILVIIFFKAKKRYLKISSFIMIIIMYCISLYYSMILCFVSYHDSYTNNLNNYLLCDDSSISKEANEYFPEKEKIKELETFYSYFYTSGPVIDEIFIITLDVNYENDYWMEKDNILSKYESVLIDNKIIVLNYQTYHDHTRVITIYFDDLNQSIKYEYIG